MKQIRTEREIQASAERVWAILTDLPGYARWNPLIREASGELREQGHLQLFIAAPGLANRRVGVQLLRVDPGRELRWLGRLFMPRLLDGDHSFLITPLSPGRVHVTQQETFSGLCVPFVTPWLIPNMTQGFQAMNEALKLQAEGAWPAAP